MHLQRQSRKSEVATSYSSYFVRMLPTNWLLEHFTTLLYFFSVLLRLFEGLVLPGPRMYAETHWKYHTVDTTSTVSIPSVQASHVQYFSRISYIWTSNISTCILLDNLIQRQIRIQKETHSQCIPRAFAICFPSISVRFKHISDASVTSGNLTFLQAQAIT